jgi:hypothetical protein
MPLVRGVMSASILRGSMLWVLRVDIAKDRCDSLPLQSVGRRHEGEGGHNHLVAQIERANCNLERDCCARHCNAMPDAEQFCNALLEFALEGPAVSEVAPVEHRFDAIEESGSVSEIRTSDMNRLGERRRCSEDGEIFSPPLFRDQ